MTYKFKYIIFGNFQMSTAVFDTIDKRVEPSRKEEERRQVTRITKTRDEAREVATVISRS